ncbi:MAG: hypothetical protein NTW97_00445 [Candidatus Krumholzibacteria bacterium]|nr:hypothetical protein [Candidatus Krumholzibacteria bacterium]
MRNVALILAMLMRVPAACLFGAARPVIVAAYAGDGEQLHNTLILVESIRTFGGRFADAPVWIYAPSNLLKTREGLVKSFAPLGAEVRPSDAPREAREVPYAGKVFAAARAEAAAKGAASILVWMDEDTVVLMEPRELVLVRGASLGYRPAMHQNIGSLYSEKPDAFWRRVYERLSVPESAVFPMKTVADGKTLRPYFNAGLLAVRPERGLLKKWAEAFSVLYRDPVLVEICRKDERVRLFLHQAALSGAIMKLLGRDEMTLLPDGYNYPLFFKETYGADKPFDTLDGVVTLRYDAYFRNPAPDGSAKLKGSAETVSWLEKRLGHGSGAGNGADTKMRFKFQRGGKPA